MPETTPKDPAQFEHDPEDLDPSHEEGGVEVQAADLLPGRAYDGETEDAKAKRTKAITGAYSAAQTSLRVAHLDEFNQMVVANAAAAGYDWQPQPTKAEKARAQIAALLEENPELAESIEVKD